MPAAARRAASVESAARSWRPRKDGWRQPAFQVAEDVAAEELKKRHGHRDRAQRTSHRRRSSDRAFLRTSSGTVTASSAYSTNLRKLTKWCRRARRRARPDGRSAKASQASRKRPGNQRPRAAAVGETGPCRDGCGRHEHDDEQRQSESLMSTLSCPTSIRARAGTARGENRNGIDAVSTSAPAELAVDQAAEARRRVRAVERLGRHRATIGVASRGNRAAPSLH